MSDLFERMIGYDYDPTWDFIDAVKSGDRQEVLRHMDEVDVNFRYYADKKTAIFHAANLDMMRVLIANGAEVNSEDVEGWTPLHHVDSAARCELLLSNNADVEAKTVCGETPLHIAAKFAKPEIVRLILAHARCSYGHDFAGDLLMETDHEGCNALHFAASGGSDEIARFLVEQCRGDGGVLLPACHQMMVAKDDGGFTPDYTAIDLWTKAKDVYFYLNSFTRLTLAAPAAASSDDVAVMLNPRLDDFQHAIATECWETIRSTCCATKVPDAVLYIVLGYLSPLDVMKR